MPKRRIKRELVKPDASASDQEKNDEILGRLGTNNSEWFMITQQTIFRLREHFMVRWRNSFRITAALLRVTTTSSPFFIKVGAFLILTSNYLNVRLWEILALYPAPVQMDDFELN
jgi:hypothetical protein